jgi:hypothetical protein
MRTVVLLAVTGAVAAGSLPLRAQSEGFVALFDGTLDGWVVENTTAGNFTVHDGVLRVEGPNGWLRSERRYADFVLRVEFRSVTPDADSGIFIRAIGDTPFMRGWPNNSYQVQVRDPARPSPFPPVGGLFRHGTPQGETALDQEAVTRLFTGTGEWQVLEIDLEGDRLIVRLNDGEVLKAANIMNSPGYIGIQGEAGVVEYRAIEIRER